MAGRRKSKITPDRSASGPTRSGVGRQPRLSQLEEAFCRCIASGMSPADAHAAAGYKIGAGVGDNPSRRRAEAGRMIGLERIRLRIDQLYVAVQPAVQEAVARSAERLIIHNEETRYWCHDQLREIARRCMAADDFRPEAAMRAVQLVGQDVGMWASQTAAAQSGQRRIAPPMQETLDVADELAQRMERINRARQKAWEHPTPPEAAPIVDVTPGAGQTTAVVLRDAAE